MPSAPYDYPDTNSLSSSSSDGTKWCAALCALCALNLCACRPPARPPAALVHAPGCNPLLIPGPLKPRSSDDEEEPTSKEGSAPDAINAMHGMHGSNNGNGSNGSKEGNGTSRWAGGGAGGAAG
jgi:hypothetical protein